MSALLNVKVKGFVVYFAFVCLHSFSTEDFHTSTVIEWENNTTAALSSAAETEKGVSTFDFGMRYWRCLSWFDALHEALDDEAAGSNTTWIRTDSEACWYCTLPLGTVPL